MSEQGNCTATKRARAEDVIVWEEFIYTEKGHFRGASCEWTYLDLEEPFHVNSLLRPSKAITLLRWDTPPPPRTSRWFTAYRYLIKIFDNVTEYTVRAHHWYLTPNSRNHYCIFTCRYSFPALRSSDGIPHFIFFISSFTNSIFHSTLISTSRHSLNSAGKNIKGPFCQDWGKKNNNNHDYHYTTAFRH